MNSNINQPQSTEIDTDFSVATSFKASRSKSSSGSVLARWHRTGPVQVTNPSSGDNDLQTQNQKQTDTQHIAFKSAHKCADAYTNYIKIRSKYLIHPNNDAAHAYRMFVTNKDE